MVEAASPFLAGYKHLITLEAAHQFFLGYLSNNHIDRLSLTLEDVQVV